MINNTIFKQYISKINIAYKGVINLTGIHEFIIDEFINTNMDEEVYFPLSKKLINKLLIAFINIKEHKPSELDDYLLKNSVHSLGTIEDVDYYINNLTKMLESDDKFIYYTDALKH